MEESSVYRTRDKLKLQVMEDSSPKRKKKSKEMDGSSPKSTKLQENFDQPDINKANFALHMQHPSSEVTEIQVKQLEFEKITSLNAETAYIIKSHHEYKDAYSKLWKFLKDAMPSTYGNLVCSPSEILCAAINCIKVLKEMQKKEVRKATVDIKTSLHSEDKSSSIMWNYHQYIAAYYKLWNFVRGTMPSTYENLIFLPPHIFCGAIDCIQMLKTKQEVEFQKMTDNIENITDPFYNSFIDRSYREFAEAFYRLWKVLRTMPDTYKIFDYSARGHLQTMFLPSQILCEAIDCIQVLKSVQGVPVTASIKLSSYCEGKSFPVLWQYPDYIDAYYKVWNMLKHTMPLVYDKLIFSPLHILYGAIDCIQELKKQKPEFQKISADIKTTLYSKDPIVQSFEKRLDAYFELWKEIKRTMPAPYRSLRFMPAYINYAAADCAKQGHQLTKREYQSLRCMPAYINYAAADCAKQGHQLTKRE